MLTLSRRRLGSLLIGIAALVSAGALTAASPRHSPEPGDRAFRECPDCPEMLGIPAGTFVMGSPPSEPGRFDTEGPQHVVRIKAFALGKYDITSAQFLGFLKDTRYQPVACNATLGMGWRAQAHGPAYAPSYDEPPKWPAVCLDWRDADAYIAWLNAKVRRLRPELTEGKGPYRLPSEAEWEYASRAGTRTARWWGDAIGVNNANCNGCGSKWDNRLLTDTDSFAPNPFGLYGVLGNAWQWTADCWHPNYRGAPTDGSPWTEKHCIRRVVRGGSWNNLPVFVRAASRSGSVTDGGEYDYSSLTGFRVARDLP
jgi:formylglycine-generating enzyme required for sulfatase activity